MTTDGAGGGDVTVVVGALREAAVVGGTVVVVGGSGSGTAEELVVASAVVDVPAVVSAATTVGAGAPRSTGRRSSPPHAARTARTSTGQRRIDQDPAPMDPATLLAAVRARTPVDERERFSVELFETHLPRLARPYDEHADPVHVTASAIVTGPRGVVLHLHKRLGLWLQPGGHIDPGETPLEGAVREATEETGLDVRPVHSDLVHVDVHPGPKGHTHLDLRFLLAPVDADADPAPAAGESPDCRWFAWDEAIGVADAGLAGALRALRPPH